MVGAGLVEVVWSRSTSRSSSPMPTRELLQRAAQQAVEWGSLDLDTEHLLWAAMQDDLVAHVVRQADGDPQAIAAQVEDEAEKGGRTDVAPVAVAGGQGRAARRLRRDARAGRLLSRARARAARAGARRRVGGRAAARRASASRTRSCAARSSAASRRPRRAAGPRARPRRSTSTAAT